MGSLDGLQAHTEPVTDSESLDGSQARVDALLSLLPTDQRAAVTLIVFGGMSVRKAAEHLGVGKSQVDRNYQAAKRTLAELFGEPAEGFSGTNRFPEETVDALDEMTSDLPPELGQYIETGPAQSGKWVLSSGSSSFGVAERPSDGDWNEYRQALIAVRRGSLVATDSDYRTVRRGREAFGPALHVQPSLERGQRVRFATDL